jgi:dihydroxyacid dehydratase/phosphogluconate dehydratase
VIRGRSDPLDEGGPLVVLRGNLCPDGAVMKVSAAHPRLPAREGRALVFEDIHDLAERVDDPDLDVDAESVMVLRNAGPSARPVCPSGVTCRSPRSSSSEASRTSCESPTRG